LIRSINWSRSITASDLLVFCFTTRTGSNLPCLQAVLLGVRERYLLANVELNMSIKDLFKEKNKVDRNDKLPIFRIDKMKEKTEK